MPDTVTIPVELAKRAIAAIYEGMGSESRAVQQSAYTDEHWSESSKMMAEWQDIADKLEAALPE